ncbi:MAG TPA: FAD-dependent oxidoreductase, partial [Candidatus Methylomirabilis sp.]|nr:FAD-dependent oxidoreductase [Candidatus Methylomirabilis sp.]
MRRRHERGDHAEDRMSMYRVNVGEQTVTEPQREIPVAYRTQVLVIGGGTAGTAAALAAARIGAQTL